MLKIKKGASYGAGEIWVAKDPYTPLKTEEELEELLSKMHGVIDWNIHQDGAVTLEYDHHLISEEVIEDALPGGIGFKVQHILDEPDADEAEARKAIEQAEEEEEN
jgi:hypothetical protein